jgi:hypothetical protein
MELGDGDDQPQQGDGFNSNPDEQGARHLLTGTADEKREGGVSGAADESEEVPDAELRKVLKLLMASSTRSTS